MRKVLAVVLGVIVSVSANAQSSLDTYRKAVAKAWERVQAAEAAAREDSIRGYTLPIARRYAGMELHADTAMLPTEFMKTLDAAFADALKDAIAIYGTRAHGVMTGMGVAVTRGASSESAVQRAQSRYAMLRSDPIGGRNFSYQTVEIDTPNRELLAHQFRMWFAEAATAAMPAGMVQWLGTTLLFPKPVNLYYTVRTIARINTRASRECLEGSLDACARLMAIQPQNDTLDKWLDLDERLARLREIERVSRNRMALRRRYLHTEEVMTAFDTCVQQRNVAACDVVSTELRRSAPLGSATRAYLLRRALERGGDDAYARLENTTATDIGDMLAVTAGVPVDSLIAEWRRDALASQPLKPTPTPKEFVGCAILGLGMVMAGVRRRA